MIPQEAAHDTLSTMPKVDLSEPAQEGTYAIARLLMKVVDFILSTFGMEHNTTLFTIIYAALIFFIAIGVGYIVKWIVVFLMNHIGTRLHSVVYGYLRDEKFFTKTARIIPAIVFLIFIEFTLNGRAFLASWLTKLTWMYICFI
ncbi:MAG: hypothetical protein K2G29_06040, partial [Muribaculaceae bacterium]|nr:hypothetical protein [Muribaculaceae bacterium]